MSIANAHIYENHIDMIHEYLKSKVHPLPIVTINNFNKAVTVHDVFVHNYKYDIYIKPPVAE